jgi:DNA-binding transcriptional MocR family regulator
VLKLAERHNFLIVEDDTFADLHPGPTTRLATLDQLDRIIYVGGFSKTLSCNMRVGFLACQPDLAAALTDVKLLSSLTTPEFNERLVYLMLVEGHYRKYAERLQGRLAEAMAGTLRMLERVGLEIYTEPKGGMFAWAMVPGLEDAAALADRAAREDILLAPGKVFRPQMQASPWLRFNVAYARDKRLERFLVQALE